MAKKKKIILPPDLPPEVADDEVEVSDEDFDFLSENRGYAGFLTNLDTNSITRHVVRVADVEEDALESLYEKRNKKLSLQKQKEEEHGIQVDPVDVLPVKTLDGNLHYRTAKEFDKIPKEDEAAVDDKDKFAVKLTKPERRKKLKKTKKEAKKQAKEKEIDDKDTLMETVQSEVLAEVKEDLTAEEVFLKKKGKLAEIGMALLEDPESNIKSLKELLQMCEDEDENIVKLGLLSLLAVFKDIIPGYRIRLPTEKELEMTVSKEVKKMRFYESTLLHSYKAYLQKLIALEKRPSFKHVTVRCMCNLLDAVPHFNFRQNLLANVIQNLTATDDVVRKLCCTTVKSLFANEGKHGGEATVEAVQLIANHVKIHDCQLPPNCIEVFLSLSFDEDLGRPASKEEENVKHKNKKRQKNEKEQKQPPASDKRRNKQDLAEKTREEVKADFKAASFVLDPEERRRIQSETLAAVFQTYFRILKHTINVVTTRPKVNTITEAGESGQQPLLTPCLDGLGKFSHLINLDFMGDLMSSLKNLASSNGSCDAVFPGGCLTVSERLQCCIVAFKVMRNNLNALNVDLQDFFVQLYNLLLEYKPDREGQGEMLAEALKIMLCEGRQHDMQRTAAFIKRLATFSLCFGSSEAMAGLVTVKHLLQKNIKCRNLLENDAGGGSLSGSTAFMDFWLSFMAVVSTFVYMATIDEVYKRAIHTIVAIVTALLAATGATRSENIMIIVAIGVLGLLVGWLIEFSTGNRFPHCSVGFPLDITARWQNISSWILNLIRNLQKRFRWHFVFLGFVGLSAAGISWKLENSRSYWIWHSIWHVTIYTSSFFFLCSTSVNDIQQGQREYQLTRQNSSSRGNSMENSESVRANGSQ